MSLPATATVRPMLLRKRKGVLKIFSNRLKLLGSNLKLLPRSHISNALKQDVYGIRVSCASMTKVEQTLRNYLLPWCRYGSTVFQSTVF